MIFISGCSSSDISVNRCQYKQNQEARREAFKECMAFIPEGTIESKHWDNIIDECDSTAYYQSREWICETEKSI